MNRIRIVIDYDLDTDKFNITAPLQGPNAKILCAGVLAAAQNFVANFDPAKHAGVQVASPGQIPPAPAMKH